MPAQWINSQIQRRCSWQTRCAGNGAQAAQRALEQEKQQREREHMAAEVLSASVKELETKTSNLEAKAADLQVSTLMPPFTSLRHIQVKTRNTAIQ